MTSPGALKADTAPAPDAFLGVAESAEGKRWILRDTDERLALTLTQRLEVPEAVGRVMAARGVGLDGAEAFLAPTLRDLLPDPSRLTDMDTAAERIAVAIMQGEGIAVFGDYDVDGATSSALIRRFVEAVEGRCRVYIPDRLREGYGPNAPALLELGREGASVIITVDCGTVAFEPLGVARDAGLDVVVVDHHVAESHLPPAAAVVNPNRLDDQSGQGQMAAVGVAFLLVVAVNRALREAGWFKSRPEPDLTQWLDLVALGTVCDVVPLTGVNRALVTQGLKVLGRRRNPGLRALADVAGVAEAPGAYHLGFVLGPRVNAGGRVGAADLGTRLLSTADAGEAEDLARRLDGFNRERQEIEKRVLDAALDSLLDDPPGAAVVAVGEAWHPGVIGIVASRLKERYNRPACVISMDPDTGLGTGSGRSVSGVDLGACVIAARQRGLLERGGGHPMAAGFTLAAGQLDGFWAFMDERVGARVSEAGIVPSLYLDGQVTTGGAGMDLIQSLERLGPFGSGNPEPRFAIKAARVTFADVVGADHVRCGFEGPEGGRLAGICFRSVGRPLGELLLKSDGRPLHLAGRLRANSWQGRVTPQMFVDDASPVW
ncbi:MAG: single-stranded-DNA-specific exonuclease RecJ [Magnetovibrio sp.]|nr:single-stranded-DNA-specific exonuclease RecJ [Magnetovibrio sp.]